MRKEWRDLLNLDGSVSKECRLIVTKADIGTKIYMWRATSCPEEYWPQRKIAMQMLVKEGWRRRRKIIEVQETVEECLRRCEKENEEIVAVRFDDDDKSTLIVNEAYLWH